jgi:hypothetical protein
MIHDSSGFFMHFIAYQRKIFGVHCSKIYALIFFIYTFCEQIGQCQYDHEVLRSHTHVPLFPPPALREQKLLSSQPTISPTPTGDLDHHGRSSSRTAGGAPGGAPAAPPHEFDLCIVLDLAVTSQALLPVFQDGRVELA